MELYLDGKPLSDFNMAVLKGFESPLTPNISHTTKHIPGRIGSWDFGSEVKERPTKYPIGLIIQDPMERALALREFTAHITDKIGRPKLMKVVSSYEPDVYMWCKASAAPSPKFYNAGADITLSLVANDPNKYALANEYDPDTPVNYGEVTPGKDYYPNTQSFNWIYSTHYSGVHNYSSYETDIRITIKGTVQGGSVTNAANNTKLTFPNISNGTLVIDSKTFSIRLNGVDTFKDTNENFFILEPGDNGFTFSAEIASAIVTFEWKHRF